MNHAIFALTAITLLVGCTGSGEDAVVLQGKVDSLQAELDRFTAEKALTEMRLARFDTLDFDFYSNQKWDSFQISHADDIRVIYPDGSVTVGLNPQHIDALEPMFVFAPDTRIQVHPVSFGSGDWTAAIGEIEGTFSQPMPIPGGGTIPPTGKSFKLAMATIGHWREGKMIEEYLFWDNQAFMRQIGLAE